MGTIIFSRYIFLCVAMVVSGIMIGSGGWTLFLGVLLAVVNSALYWQNMRDGVYGSWF